MTEFEDIWRVPDTRMQTGRIPGYVGAVRIGDTTEVRAAGTMAIDGAPMREDTLFRIASVTKPIGGALTLSLIEDGVLALDDPITNWLPEAEDLDVLEAPDAPLDRTTKAKRPITVRHLLTFTSGWGVGMESTPLHTAMRERGVDPGPLTPPSTGDEFLAQLTTLPLAFQPGEGWRYDTSMDVLAVLLARATGKPVSHLLAERVTGPLNMSSTAYFAADVDRLATAYMPGPDGVLDLLDPPAGNYAAPPPFEELGSGLVSTAEDVLRFYCAMADGGAPLLTSGSVAQMTADALTGLQRDAALPFLGEGVSWGFATGVESDGRWGWDGGTGTTARVDPARDTVAVLLTQRAMTGPLDGFDDFHAAVAAAG
jgi:CubicO group peptidase (beta-lactamase class C family)